MSLEKYGSHRSCRNAVWHDIGEFWLVLNLGQLPLHARDWVGFELSVFTPSTQSKLATSSSGHIATCVYFHVSACVLSARWWLNKLLCWPMRASEEHHSTFGNNGQQQSRTVACDFSLPHDRRKPFRVCLTSPLKASPTQKSRPHLAHLSRSASAAEDDGSRSSTGAHAQFNVQRVSDALNEATRELDTGGLRPS